MRLRSWSWSVPTSRRPGVWEAALLMLTASPASAQVSFFNPINATIPQSSLSAEVVDVINIPNSTNGSEPRLDFLTHVPDGSGRLVVSDQRGRLWGFTPGDQNPALMMTTADMPGFFDGNERGLRGFAFHPDFAVPGAAGENKLYVAYSTFASGTPDYPVPNGFTTNHHSVVAEYAVNPDTLDVGTRRELIRIGQPFGNHNIGQVGFNPVPRSDDDHGNLYIALGDGGSANDPLNAGQRRDTPLGSILRIDPTPSGGGAYDIPDNPFVDTPAFAPEIYLWGARNPHRFAWDPVSFGGDGRMFFSDIGQESVEEINVGRAGANYGWVAREGTFNHNANGDLNPLGAGHPNDTVEYPVAQYDHDFNNNGIKEAGVSIVGGFVYYDDALPDLQGKYFFGDFANQEDGPIYIVDTDDLIERDDFSDLASLNNGLLAPYEELQLTRNGNPLSSFEALVRSASGNAFLSRSDLRFGEDADGAIYLLNKHDGWVRKLLPGPRAATDFDFSGSSDLEDLEALIDALTGQGPSRPIYNVDGIGGVGNSDYFAWLSAVGVTLGDANLNGLIEQGDLNAVLTNWGDTNATNPNLGWATGDFNLNGLVEQGDLNTVLTNWGDTAAPDFTGFDIPEPGVGFALLTLMSCVTRRRA